VRRKQWQLIKMNAAFCTSPPFRLFPFSFGSYLTQVRQSSPISPLKR
jgi:hypothetical protein